MEKLTIELVPNTSWYSNVRSILPKKEWDRLRKDSYWAAKYKCEVCGGVGPEHPVECHEIWDYNDKDKTQTLLGLISLCPPCHQVKHMGYANTIGKGREAEEHLSKVNGWTREETIKYVNDAFDVWSKRSKYEWKIDVSILIDKYKVDSKLIAEGYK